MNILIFSVHADNINPEIPKYQSLVFEKFNLDIYHSVYDGINVDYSYKQHGRQINHVLDTHDNDYFIIFDIDCIPLSYNFYPRILEQIKDGDILAGGVQCANHIDKSRLYVSPAFCGFSRKLYEKVGRPKFEHLHNEPPQYDTGQFFSDKCPNKIYWNVTDSIDQIWDLEPLNSKFGHGTIFENLIYHQFQTSTFEMQQQCFINKCKEILNR